MLWSSMCLSRLVLPCAGSECHLGGGRKVIKTFCTVLELISAFASPSLAHGKLRGFSSRGGKKDVNVSIYIHSIRVIYSMHPQ